MNEQQLKRMKEDKGFIAALDQSGGSTPKALAAYGVNEGAYSTDEEMFDLIHEARTRMITSPSFSSDYILAAILFKHTMERQINGVDTGDYLWGEKGVVPILKVDNGLADAENGVQLMKPIPELSDLCARGVEKHMFGTKMRSVILENNSAGIAAIVDQQFEFGCQIIAAGLVPIIEPEVNIHAEDKAAIEDEMVRQLLVALDQLTEDQNVMLKLTLPEKDNLYTELIQHPRVVRVVALSGGYSQEEANTRLTKNNGLIASFSRALASGLFKDQTDDEYNNHLKASVEGIYNASLT